MIKEEFKDRTKIALKGKNIPESFWAKWDITIESEEQLTSVVTQIESDWTKFKKDHLNAGPVSDAQGLARQIEQGTKEMVEKVGGKHQPIDYDVVNPKNTKEKERKEFTDNLVSQINEGTEDDKKYAEWYEKEYGQKFKPGNSNYQSHKDKTHN